MKQKLILTITLASLLILATVAMANGTLITQTIFEDATDYSEFDLSIEEGTEFELDFSTLPEIPTAPSIEIVEEEIFFSDEFAESALVEFDEHINSGHIDSLTQKQTKNKFINTMVDYRMTTSEAEYISSLLEEYDADTILDIYKFLRWTDADISVIPQIYSEWEENCEDKHWIYTAYDKLFNRTDDMLSVEDVAYYVGSGITIDEIVGAYELSFSGVKSTKEMLDERLCGESWNNITASVISDAPEVIIAAPEMTISDILNFHNYSVKMRKDISEIISVENDTVELTANAVSELQNSHSLKQKFIKQFDAEVTPVKTESADKSTISSNSSPFTYEQDEYLYEEDYIPVEEPEEVE